MSNLAHPLSDSEYPIIWFETNLDSKPEALIQGNRSIYFFSELETALDFLQSLNSSFFIMTSVSTDEQKLIQDFSSVKETYAERLFDFEEESFFIELQKSVTVQLPMESLKVHFFYSKNDFENHSTPNDEEEEVMLMCNVDDMIKQFREDFIVLWCDPHIIHEKKELLKKEFDLDEKNIYTNFADLLGRMANYDGPPYHLILSGQTQTEIITSNLDQFQDLLLCYIYGNPPKSADKRVKIQSTLEELLLKIRQGIRTKSKHKNTFPSFATNFDDRDKSYINKVHYYLRGFINFKNRKQAKKDFMNLAKKFHQSDKLIDFGETYFEYDREKIFNWYTQETPLYKLVNNAIRISNSDSILYCRFLIKDLERAVKEEYNQESNRFSGEAYRGAYISKDELEKLEANIGKEIEMYGFLSTSTNLDMAYKFYKKDCENKILITITVPPSPLTEFDEQGFADISRFSKFPKEKEILFNIRSRFQILEVGTKEVKGTQCRHLVLLYRALLLRKYMTIKKPIINLNFELPSEFTCKSCSSKNNLFAFHKDSTQIICKECLLKDSLKNVFFLPLARDQTERNIKIEFLGSNLKYNDTNTSSARNFYGDKCDDCSNSRQAEETTYFKIIDPKTSIYKIQCSACFESHQDFIGDHLILLEENPFTFWQSKQEGWGEINTHFKTKEFQISDEMKGVDVFYHAQDYEKCQELCLKNLKSFVHQRKGKAIRIESCESLGKNFYSLGAYEKALKYHLRVLKFRKFTLGKTHPLTATSYHNVAVVYKSLAEHQRALKYHLKALDIRKKVYEGELHFSIADSYNAMAEIYHTLGEYQKALDHHHKALDIITKFFGTEAHPKSADSYHNIALVHYKSGKYKEALQDHKKALDIRKSIYGEIHSDTATSYHNIAETYSCLAKNKEATDCFAKSLEIRKCLYVVEAHPSTADSYASIASLYRRLSKPQESIEYHKKALKIRKEFFREKHPSLADSYSNLALVYNDLGKHKKALKHHQKALKIIKSVYGEAHVDIAILCNNLAGGYKRLGNYNSALEFYGKALTISREIFGEMHPSTATSLNNLGLIYNILGKYQEALDYQQKALDIRNEIYSEVHPNIADSYNNVATVYYNQGRYDKVLEYYFKALSIAKTVYGETHTSIADLYDNIGACYENSFEDYQKALEYYKKALNMKKIIYKIKMHPSIAESYSYLASLYRSLKRFKKALKFERNALGIRRCIFGETHPDTASSHNNFALTLNHIGKYQKALKHYLKTFDIRKSTYGKEHRLIADVYDNLASTFSHLGENQKALEYRWRAFNVRKSISQTENSEMASFYNSIASVNHRLGQLQRALKYFMKALHLRKFLNDEMHPLTADSYHNLAVVYNDMDDHKTAIKYHLQAFQIRTSVCGETHPDTLESSIHIAMTHQHLEESE